MGLEAFPLGPLSTAAPFGLRFPGFSQPLPPFGLSLSKPARASSPPFGLSLSKPVRASSLPFGLSPSKPVRASFPPFGLSLSKPWWRTALAWKTAPGFRPGSRVTFLCFAKEKSPKERRPDCGGPGVPGLLCAARSGREMQKLARVRAQTSAFLFPPSPALLDAADGARRATPANGSLRIAAGVTAAALQDPGGQQRLLVKRRENVARGVVVASRIKSSLPTIPVQAPSVKWLVLGAFFGDFLCTSKESYPPCRGGFPARSAKPRKRFRKQGFDRLSLNGGGEARAGFDRLGLKGWEVHTGTAPATQVTPPGTPPPAPAAGPPGRAASPPPRPTLRPGRRCAASSRRAERWLR
jgi:hypothetical protein